MTELLTQTFEAPTIPAIELPYPPETLDLIDSPVQHTEQLGEEEYARTTEANRDKFRAFAFELINQNGVSEISGEGDQLKVDASLPLAAKEKPDGTNRTELVLIALAGTKPYAIVRHREHPGGDWSTYIADGGTAGKKVNGEPYIGGVQAMGQGESIVGRSSTKFKGHSKLESREHFGVSVSEHDSNEIVVRNLSKNGTSLVAVASE